MFGTFQEISPVGAYVFSGKSCSVATHSKIKKLTVSQELLNEIIAVRGYSIKEISQETKIPLSSLHRIKSGITKNPRFHVFQKIFGLYCQICQ